MNEKTFAIERERVGEVSLVLVKAPLLIFSQKFLIISLLWMLINDHTISTTESGEEFSKLSQIYCSTLSS